MTGQTTSEERRCADRTRSVRPFVERRGHSAYRRTVRSAFATVPYYRELWSLTEQGRPSTVEDLTAREPDLVPLRAGGARTVPWRGLEASVRITRGSRLPRATRIVASGTRPADPAPSGRGGHAAGWASRVAAVTEWVGRIGRGGNGNQEHPPRGVTVAPAEDLADVVGALVASGSGVVAVGDHTELARVQASGPRVSTLVRCDPRELPSAAPEGGAVLYLPLLGYLGGLAPCGRWHLAVHQVYARPLSDSGGVAVTLLHQRSPRLVDVSLGDSVRLDRCPRHRTPVLTG